MRDGTFQGLFATANAGFQHLTAEPFTFVLGTKAEPSIFAARHGHSKQQSFSCLQRMCNGSHKSSGVCPELCVMGELCLMCTYVSCLVISQACS